MKHTTNLFLACLALFIFSCQSDNKNQEVVTEDETNESATGNIDYYQEDNTNNPYAKLVKLQTYEVDPNKDINFTTDNGMKVSIPKNTLVDQNGNTPKGPISVNIKEYYSAGDIILSGIPMGYSDGENTYPFESDGMFTINATDQNGEDLKVKDNAKIALETQRNKSGEGFEFYELNNNKWSKDETNNIAVVNTTGRLPVLLKPTEPYIVEPLIKFNPNYYTLEKDDRYANPHLKSTQRNQDNDFELVTQIDLDVKQNPWLLDRSKWRIPKHGHYILKENTQDKEIMDTVKFKYVQAVRGNKKYAQLKERNEQRRAKYTEDLVAYNENFAARKAAGQLSNQEIAQELLISQFGTYNIDRYYSQPADMVVEKEYQIAKPQVEANTAQLAYLIVKRQDGPGFMPIDLKAYGNLMRFNKREANAVVVLANQKFYGMKKVDFKKTIEEQIKDADFRLDLEELNFTTSEDFNKALESLF